MNHYGSSVFEEHHCIETILSVFKTMRMEYPLDEVAASVSNDTESGEQVAVAKLSLSDIISSGTINKNFDALILVRSALTISQIFDPVPPDYSIIAEARKCLILGERLINEL
jgi:hypothetical protein